MKKRTACTRLLMGLAALTAVLGLGSCGNLISTMISEITTGKSTTIYAIGDTGPAGGLIFYDAGPSSTYGWRYLEAATEDAYGKWSSTAPKTGATGTAIGTGASNTELIVKNDSWTYAALYCANYSVVSNGTTYEDWFLPSLDELSLLYTNLCAKSLGGFDTTQYYWCSTENEIASTTAYQVSFGDGSISHYEKGISFPFRPVRAFK